LQQPQTLNLIDDMIANANYAYTGQTDPNTGQMRQGVVWIHEHIQELAVLNVSKFTSFQSLRREGKETLLAALPTQIVEMSNPKRSSEHGLNT
jgi:hypothetical protein